MELVDFLRERLNEEAGLAGAATPGPWWYNPGKQWLDPDAFEKYDLAKGEEFVGYGGPHPFTGAVAATGPADHPQSMADAAHIARHDPARVLAGAAALRALLAFVELPEGSYYEWQLLVPFARVWRDHPDFDPAWLGD